MFFTNPFKSRLPAPEEALAGRSKPIAVLHPHAVSGQPCCRLFQRVQANLPRFRLLLGRRTLVLANGWCLDYCGRLYGRLD